MKILQNNTTFLAITSLILFIIIFIWIHYLFYQEYIIECFTNNIIQEQQNGSTSHTVNLPLTTTYSCNNFCGPTSRCAITGQQCFTDIDCPGCQPYSPPLKKETTNCVPGDNDAGKLTIGVTPQYSTLTSGYGTREKIIIKDVYAKPYEPNFGINTWISEYNEEKNLFDDRYQPSGLQFMPNYPKRYSLSGQFMEDGPFASNSYL